MISPPEIMIALSISKVNSFLKFLLKNLKSCGIVFSKWGDIVAEFKDRLEQALQIRNMKPSELSKITGIGEGAISQYRKGGYKASQRNLEKISRALQFPIPWLMGISNDVDDEEKPTAGQGGGPKERAHQLLDQIPEEKLQEVISYMNFLKSQQENEGHS